MKHEINLSQGYVAKIDAADLNLVSQHCWHLHNSNGKLYAATGGGRKRIFMHSLIFGSLGIDHKDGDGLNNSRENLRKASHCQNMQNRKLGKNSTSGYKGVSFDKSVGLWKASIGHNFRRYNLGRFSTKEQAALAYDKKAKELHGNFAVLNFGEA